MLTQKNLAVVLVVITSCSTILAQRPLDDTKPTLGLKVINTREAISAWKESKLPMRLVPKKGVFIGNIIVGSEAFKAGVRQFDLLEKVDSKPVRTIERINELIENKSPGDEVELQIRRLNGNAWTPLKATIKCGTERTAAYSQLRLSGSSVTENYQAQHLWFEGEKNYFSPIIISGKTPSMIVEISLIGESAIFPKEVTIKSNDKLASLPIEALKADTKIIDGGVQQTVRTKLTDESIELLRASGTKLYRCDGLNKYAEHEIDSTSKAAIDVVLAVFDDIRATGNQDFSLGGRVQR